MNKQKAYLRYFGLLTIAVEWIGFSLALHYCTNFDFNKAISTFSVAAQPLPLIFSTTITLASICFFLFSLYLRPYAKNAPLLGAVSSGAFIIVGWTPFRGVGGTADLLHNVFSIIAALGYTLLIWECRKHPIKHVRLASSATVLVLVLTLGVSYWSLFIVHKYVAFVEIAIVVLMQVWLVLVTWHSPFVHAKNPTPSGKHERQ